MIMEKEFENWRKYLTEKEKPVQDEYEAHFYLALTQSKEIDRTELMGFMRAIQNVTTVYREKEVSTSAQTFVGEYKIRFVLTHGADVKYYYDTVLKPGLRKIKGLSIQRDLSYEKTGEE
jgi:hypothetical protein